MSVKFHKKIGCFHWFSSRLFTVYSGKLFHDQTFEAFRSAINDGDLEPMSRALEPHMAETLSMILSVKYGVGGGLAAMGSLMSAMFGFDNTD